MYVKRRAAHVNKRIGLWIGYAVCIGAIVVSTTQMLTAGYSSDDLTTHIQIDGTDYGKFDLVHDIDAPEIIQTTSGSYKKIVLKRDFVTDPSLYLWAKNMMKERTGLKNIVLTTTGPEGETKARYELKLCQPLSWTVEAANPALGGFHEKVEIAVQDITVF